MTADRTMPDESTPRRGFGLARLVLRVVSAALSPVRKVAEGVLRKKQATRRSLALAAARATARRRRRALSLERWLMALAPEARRAFVDAMREGWQRLRPPTTLLRSIRRYYLGTV